SGERDGLLDRAVFRSLGDLDGDLARGQTDLAGAADVRERPAAEQHLTADVGALRRGEPFEPAKGCAVGAAGIREAKTDRRRPARRGVVDAKVDGEHQGTHAV